MKNKLNSDAERTLISKIQDLSSFTDMNEQAVCTIITKSYLPFARALSHSLREHSPNLRLYVLLADELDGSFNPTEEPFTTILLEELPDQDLVRKMCFYYTAFELCCALRGMLHEYMYDKNIADSWLFLDSDILTYSSLQEIFNQLEKTSILLNPHLLNPVNQPYVYDVEVGVLVSGIYNAGFLGLKRSEETRRFIDWFKDRLIHYGFNRRGKEAIFKLLFVDQLWLNFVPHFFNEVSFLVHPGANVGYWSLISHKITKENNIYLINNKPLLFIHFSGWNISQPSQVSTYLSIGENISIWKELGEHYKELLLNHGYEECRNYPYAFSSFSNDQKIIPEMRYLYYEKTVNNEVAQTDPFSENNYFILKRLLKSNRTSIYSALSVLQKHWIKYKKMLQLF